MFMLGQDLEKKTQFNHLLYENVLKKISFFFSFFSSTKDVELITPFCVAPISSLNTSDTGEITS